MTFAANWFTTLIGTFLILMLISGIYAIGNWIKDRWL